MINMYVCMYVCLYYASWTSGSWTERSAGMFLHCLSLLPIFTAYLLSIFTTYLSIFTTYLYCLSVLLIFTAYLYYLSLLLLQ
jgi:hypothetical protein